MDGWIIDDRMVGLMDGWTDGSIIDGWTDRLGITCIIKDGWHLLCREKSVSQLIIMITAAMLLFGIIVFLSVTPLADCACTFPISGDYETSHNGEITFNETHLYYEVNNKGFLNFECYMTSGTKYIALSEQFQVFNSYLRAVICFDITTLKTSLYQMGIYTLKLQDADYQRVKFIDTTTTITDAVACTDNANTDKSIFMEKGTISSLTIQCPDILLGRFSYSFNDTDCLNETGYLDVCTDLTMMSYNYSYCSTIQAYSQNGSLNCLYSTTDGTTTSLYTYNLDTSPDETDYYRFTCFKVMQNGSQVVATQRPQDCLGTQTATSVDYTGATLTMTASVPTTTTTAASVSSAGLIAGIAVGLIILLIIVGVIIAYCIYLKYFKKDRVEPRKGLPPTSTGMPSLMNDHGKQNGGLHREFSVASTVGSRSNLIVTPSVLKPTLTSTKDAIEIPVPVDARKNQLPPLTDRSMNNFPTGRQNDEEAGQFEDDMADAAEVVAVADNQPMLVSTYTGSPVNNAVKEEVSP
ncbi:hypothetical protein FSP39_021017 [Pinctada imbricata]|uniref:DUF7042 domain-containing protein n=1 Tax=Pinctada imbricata TaxID=66713 RepID=A0AA89C4B5_PINIB|nr:hypothetical protein FSP39_021017 [Pinctada imbricata]